MKMAHEDSGLILPPREKRKPVMEYRNFRKVNGACSTQRPSVFSSGAESLSGSGKARFHIANWTQYRRSLISLQLHSHVEVVGGEGPGVRNLVDLLRDRFTGAVSGLGFHTNQHRRRPGLISLHGGGELEAVSGHDPVVVIGGGDEGSGILCYWLQVV